VLFYLKFKHSSGLCKLIKHNIIKQKIKMWRKRKKEKEKQEKGIKEERGGICS